MGCVQSYFKKGSYDVYEAHNAGMSPSSTQGSEKAPLDEEEIKAQEDKDNVQTAEIGRDLAPTNEAKVKTLPDKEDANEPEAANKSVLGAAAATATVAGSGAVAAVAAVKAAEGTDSSQAEVSEEKVLTEDVPVAETASSPTDKPQESDDSDTKKCLENVDDIEKTELEEVAPINVCSPVTSVKHDEAPSPLLNNRPESVANASNISDSQERTNEPASSDADITEKESVSITKCNDVNEAILLEETVRETDDFVVINKHVEEITPRTAVDVNNRPAEPNLAGKHSNDSSVSNEEINICNINVDTCEEIPIENSTGSRPSSKETETHKINICENSSASPSEESAPNESVSVATENVSDLSGTFSAVEPGKEAIPSRPTSVASEKVELGKVTSLVTPEDININTVEEHAVYSSSVDSAEEALSSRPLSVASWTVEEPAKERNTTEIPLENSVDINEEYSETSLPLGTAVEIVISRPISAANEEPLKQTSQAKQESLQSETDKVNDNVVSQIELSEVAVRSRPTSVESDALEGSGKEPNSIRPLSTAVEVNEGIAQNYSKIEEAADVISERPPSTISDTREPKESATPINKEYISEKVNDHIEITPTSEYTEDEIKIYEQEAKPPLTEPAEVINACSPVDTSNNSSGENPDTIFSTEHKEETITITPLNVSEENNKDHAKIPMPVDTAEEALIPTPVDTAEEALIPTPVDTAEEALSSTPLVTANKSSEEHNEKLPSEKVLEERVLSRPSSVSHVLAEELTDDLSSKAPKESELINSGGSETVQEHTEKQSSIQSSENTAINSYLITNSLITENSSDHISPSEVAEKELGSSPLSVASEAVENHYENISPAESAEEKATSRPSSVVSETVIEQFEKVSVFNIPENESLSKQSNDINEAVNFAENSSIIGHIEEDKTRTPTSSPVKTDLSEECLEKPSNIVATGEISVLDSSIFSEMANEISSREHSSNIAETKIVPLPGSADKVDSNQSFNFASEIIEDNLDSSSHTHFEDETVSNEGNEYVGERDKMSPTEEKFPSRLPSVTTETVGTTSENSPSVSPIEYTVTSRPVSANFNEPVKDTAASGTVEADNEYTETNRLVDAPEKALNEPEDKTTDDLLEDASFHTNTHYNANAITASPTLSSTEDSTDIPSSGNELKESTAVEVERTAESATCTESVPENKESTPNLAGMNQQVVGVEGETFDSGLFSKEKEDIIPFINDKLDDNTTEDSTAVDNDTEEVEKEDSTIASIPESVMTVPESMGDMELSSESSTGGPAEKSSEERRSEDVKPDEQDDNSLVANMFDEPSASESSDVKSLDSPEHNNQISSRIVNGVYDENAEHVYADAFGRPVPTINLIESEEQKRSDSEEDNVETMSPQNEETCQVTQEKEVEIPMSKELTQDGTSAEMSQVNYAQGDEEGEESASESVAGSDSINLRHRGEGRSDSGTSHSRADFVVAEKGSEVDSITTVSAAPSADGARLISEEEQEANSKEPAVLQSPSSSSCDGANDADKAALNTAATTIQASFKGFQTRQALQKSVKTTEVPTEENRQASARKKGSEHLSKPDPGNIPEKDSKEETNVDEVSPETSESSAARGSALEGPGDEEPAEHTQDASEDLASLQKPQECDELPEHRGELNTDGLEVSSSGDIDSSLSSAATKIQSSFRGYMARKQLRDTVDDSTVISLTNEPSIPDSQQSLGTFSTSNEDNGVRTSGSLETAVQRQQQSTLEEIEELVGSGPSMLVDTTMPQIDKINLPDDSVTTYIGAQDETKVSETNQAIKGLSLDSKVDANTKNEKPEVKSSSLQENSALDNNEDLKVWVTLEKEISEAATKIQSNYRGYRTRQKLTREDAVQFPTTSTSSAASVDSEKTYTDVRASGEFHDMMVLPPAEITKLINGDDAADVSKA